MVKGFLYSVKGDYSFPDLPIEMLVDIEELVHFNKIKPVDYKKDIPSFSATDIEAVAIEIYQEYLLTKDLVNRQQSFKLQIVPYIEQKIEYYFYKNPKLLENNVLQRFIEEDYNLNVLALSLFAEKECKERLDNIFREFYFEYRFIAYISQIIYYEAINYDKGKIRLEID